MDDLEEKLVEAVTKLESVVEEAADADSDLGERLRAKLDAATPALDDMQDELSREPDESEGA